MCNGAAGALWNRVVHLVGGAILCMAGWEIAGPAAATPPTAADLVDLRRAEEVQIAPDGTKVAFTVRAFASSADASAKAHPAIFAIPTDGMNKPRRLTPKGRAAHSPRWHPDGKSIAMLMDDEAAGTQIFIMSLEHETTQQVTSVAGGLAGSPALAWSPDGRYLAYTAPDPQAVAQWRQRDPKLASTREPHNRLWIANLDNLATWSITPEELNVDALAWAPDGERLALVAEVRGRKGHSLLTISRDGRNQSILSEQAASHGSRDQTLDWSPDGQSIAFGYTRVPDGTRRWLGLVSAEGGEVEEHLESYGGHVMRAVWLPDSRSLLAQSFQGLQSRLLRVSADTGETEELQIFQAQYPRFDLSDDGARIAYLGQAANAPANVHLYEMEGESRRLTDLNPAIREMELGQVEPVTWRNEKDDLTLEGILVTPPKAIAKPPYPLVTQIHGGPHFHWGLGWLGGWNDWAQWLAPRGYAVFLPNPRGSTGRGWDFATAIHQQLGGPDGDDILSGVDALVDRGIADPERLYIGGHSYGGFLTAWLLTRTDRFRAAVVNAGISDLVSFAGTAGLGEHWSRTYFPDDVQHRMAAYRDRSPLTYLHRLTTPTLILHGEEDPKIPPSQAWQLYSGLQNLGIESELAIYPRAGHGLSERSHQLHALESILDWYETH